MECSVSSSERAELSAVIDVIYSFLSRRDNLDMLAVKEDSTLIERYCGWYS